MYNSISIELALPCTRSFKNKLSELQIYEILNLISLYITMNVVQFEDKFYIQEGGLAMALSPILAIIIIMDHLEFLFLKPELVYWAHTLCGRWKLD